VVFLRWGVGDVSTFYSKDHSKPTDTIVLDNFGPPPKE